MPVQRLTQADGLDLAALHGQCFIEDGAWSASFFANLLQRDTGVAYGCYAAQKLIAMSVFQSVHPEVELLTMCTHPGARRQGHADKVLRFALTDLARTGITTAHLEVAEDNEEAIRLYKGLGFGQSGRRHGYYEAGTGPRRNALQFTCNIARQP